MVEPLDAKMLEVKFNAGQMNSKFFANYSVESMAKFITVNWVVGENGKSIPLMVCRTILLNGI